jgi:hypothetical protein
VQLLVVADGNHDVTRDDTDTLVITRGVSGELEDLSSQVLQDGSEVDGGSDTNTASILALLELTVETSDGEGQTGLVGAGLVRSLGSLGGGSGSLLGSHLITGHSEEERVRNEFFARLRFARRLSVPSYYEQHTRVAHYAGEA